MSTSEDVTTHAETGQATGTRSSGLMLLVVLLIAQFTVALDFSVLNVALPDIGDSLGMSLSNLQWVVTAFALASAGFTLLFGRLADLVGRRPMFLAGIVLLGMASLLGGLAGDATTVLVARVGQGLATAILAPVAMALLTTSFPEGPRRQRAIGLGGAMLAAGFTVGAVLGGVLTGLFGWQWAFLVNVPLCVVVLLVAPALLPKDQQRERTRLDLGGTVTITGGLLALVYGITAAGDRGLGNPATLTSLGVAVVLLTAFWLVEIRVPAPLVSLRVLRRPTVALGNVGGLVTFTMFSAVIFLMTLYLQRVLGFSPLVTGLAFGVQGVTAFLAGVFAPRLIGRFGSSQATLVGGLLVQAAATGTLLLAGGTRDSLLLVVIAVAVGGFGHVLSVVSFMVTATSGLPDERQGLATGIASLTQQVGITIGIPIMSAIATARIDTLSATGSDADAVLGGTSLALTVDAVIVVVAAMVIGMFLRRAARP